MSLESDLVRPMLAPIDEKSEPMELVLFENSVKEVQETHMNTLSVSEQRRRNVPSCWCLKTVRA